MWLTILLLVTLFAPAAAAQTAQSSSDETAIRKIVSDYVNARTLSDPKAIEALFTTDADQHTTGGEWRRGRAQVVAGTLASSKRNPGARSITVSSVRFITPDVAIADGPYLIGDGANPRRNWTTIVVQRERDRWRIAAIRNASPTTP
jgi:uncharacterized protein (TIGR02246 family)